MKNELYDNDDNPVLVISIAISIVIILFVAFSYVMHLDNKKLVQSVQSGVAQISCVFSDGERIVSPDMVVGYSDGIWEFKNGYSKSCTYSIKRDK